MLGLRKDSEPENMSVEICKTKKKTGKNCLKKENIPKLWDNYKMYNLCVIGIPKTEKREKGIEEILESIMT